MSEYQFATRNGIIINEDYDGVSLSTEQVLQELRAAFAVLRDGVEVASVSEEYKEVYQATIPGDAGPGLSFYICAKGTTPGGRKNLKNEQRIQQKAKYLNFAFDKLEAGEIAVSLGVYKKGSETVFCAWRLSKSEASSLDTPISKQIKIESIAKALSEGFVQQEKGVGEYACAFRKEFILFYILNSHWLHTAPVRKLSQNSTAVADVADDDQEYYNFSSAVTGAVNKIFYGVPGCGKSYHIQHEVLEKGKYAPKNIIRTTFYQDYSNTDFVGQILPKVVKGENGEKDLVKYTFNPGPFTLALIQAINNPSKKVALVIEEINRGNAPAIFGDIFQLLDRDGDGLSEYGIVNVNLIDYLNDYLFNVDGVETRYQFNQIKLPGNLDIFATMNTSDQNVYTLDTAFTRRWAKVRMPNDFKGHPIQKCLVPGMEQYTWKTFVDYINDRIQKKLDELQVNEDKQVGAFFVKETDLIVPGANLSALDKAKKVELFAYKVLEYLWDDVSKLDRSVLFNPAYNTFESLVQDYIKNGVKIFNGEVFQKAPIEGGSTRVAPEEIVAEAN